MDMTAHKSTWLTLTWQFVSKSFIQYINLSENIDLNLAVIPFGFFTGWWGLWTLPLLKVIIQSVWVKVFLTFPIIHIWWAQIQSFPTCLFLMFIALQSLQTNWTIKSQEFMKGNHQKLTNIIIKDPNLRAIWENHNKRSDAIVKAEIGQSRIILINLILENSKMFDNSFFVIFKPFTNQMYLFCVCKCLSK